MGVTVQDYEYRCQINGLGIIKDALVEERKITSWVKLALEN